MARRKNFVFISQQQTSSASGDPFKAYLYQLASMKMMLNNWHEPCEMNYRQAAQASRN